ncbi:hypothetical protein KUF71_002436 [Frankliniella fusca]|uniref:Uncharacterized protein n=1 Tax=Frankliniella fusca TaxID=407009 RepID=A0AAE1HNX4_9NEOP|nr:hypothetical protein KUF71_002436 [Frankliniella fusca]
MRKYFRFIKPPLAVERVIFLLFFFFVFLFYFVLFYQPSRDKAMSKKSILCQTGYLYPNIADILCLTKFNEFRYILVASSPINICVNTLQKKNSIVCIALNPKIVICNEDVNHRVGLFGLLFPDVFMYEGCKWTTKAKAKISSLCTGDQKAERWRKSGS